MPQTHAGSGVTISTTEWSLTNGSAVIASQATEVHASVVLSAPALTTGDTYRLRIYDKTVSTSPQVVIHEEVLDGASGNVFATPPVHLIHCWDFSLTKLTGTDRAWTWSVRS